MKNFLELMVHHCYSLGAGGVEGTSSANVDGWVLWEAIRGRAKGDTIVPMKL